MRILTFQSVRMFFYLKKLKTQTPSTGKGKRESLHIKGKAVINMLEVGQRGL